LFVFQGGRARESVGLPPKEAKGRIEAGPKGEDAGTFLGGEDVLLCLGQRLKRDGVKRPKKMALVWGEGFGICGGGQGAEPT